MSPVLAVILGTCLGLSAAAVPVPDGDCENPQSSHSKVLIQQDRQLLQSAVVGQSVQQHQQEPDEPGESIDEQAAQDAGEPAGAETEAPAVDQSLASQEQAEPQEQAESQEKPPKEEKKDGGAAGPQDEPFLSDAGFKSVALQNDDKAMLRFVKRVTDHLGLQETAKSDGILLKISGKHIGQEGAELKTLTKELLEAGKAEKLSSIVSVKKDAPPPLNENGYKFVVQEHDDKKMAEFIERAAKQEGYKITDKKKLGGVAPFYNGFLGLQTFADLQAEFKKVSKEKDGWAAKGEDSKADEKDEDSKADEKAEEGKKAEDKSAEAGKKEEAAAASTEQADQEAGKQEDKAEKAEEKSEKADEQAAPATEEEAAASTEEAAAPAEEKQQDKAEKAEDKSGEAKDGEKNEQAAPSTEEAAAASEEGAAAAPTEEESAAAKTENAEQATDGKAEAPATEEAAAAPAEQAAPPAATEQAAAAAAPTTAPQAAPAQPASLISHKPAHKKDTKKPKAEEKKAAKKPLEEVAAFNQDAYMEIVNLKSEAAMSTYVHRLIDALHLEVTNGEGMDSIECLDPKQAPKTTFFNTLKLLLKESSKRTWIKSTLQPRPGDKADLTEDGYIATVLMQNNDMMELFIKRVIEEDGMQLVGKQGSGGVSGMAPYYSGVVGFQDFNRLKTEIKEKAMDVNTAWLARSAGGNKVSKK